MAEGDLTERARQRARELARDADLRRSAPPGLRVPAAPTDLKSASGRILVSRDDRLPMPGVTLTRVFKGHEYRVLVLSNGFEYDGRAYRSLSAVAYAISGSHWNGYRFFNIQTPERVGRGGRDAVPERPRRKGSGATHGHVGREEDAA